VLIFAGIELLTGVTGTGGGIAHFAHLGGLIFGFLLIMYWKRNRTLYSRYD
jgi:membrane associated rhomboid family serine protease